MALNLGLNFPKLIPVWLKLNFNSILNLQKSVTEFAKLTEVGEKAYFSKFKIASLHNLMLHYKIDIYTNKGTVRVCVCVPRHTFCLKKPVFCIMPNQCQTQLMPNPTDTKPNQCQTQLMPNPTDAKPNRCQTQLMQNPTEAKPR